MQWYGFVRGKWENVENLMENKKQSLVIKKLGKQKLIKKKIKVKRTTKRMTFAIIPSFILGHICLYGFQRDVGSGNKPIGRYGLFWQEHTDYGGHNRIISVSLCRSVGLAPFCVHIHK